MERAPPIDPARGTDRSPLSPEITLGDLDITLRHVAQRMPDAYARGVLGARASFEVEAWQDTQVAASERRLDRVLSVRVEGRRRWLHVEWEWEWTRDTAARVYEYQALLALAQRDARNALHRAPLSSTVVLLSGREAPWPSWGRHRVSPRGEPFSGARFRVDPVYQSTVAELVSRGSLLWMVFAPLVRDASPATLPQALDAARRRARDEGELVEVVTAMTVVAESTAAKPNVREWLMTIVDEGLIERSWPYQRGEARGLAPIVHLFERRLARPLAAFETQRLRERLVTLGPERLGDVVIDLDPAALAAWLADADAR